MPCKSRKIELNNLNLDEFVPVKKLNSPERNDRHGLQNKKGVPSKQNISYHISA